MSTTFQRCNFGWEFSEILRCHWLSVLGNSKKLLLGYSLSRYITYTCTGRLCPCLNVWYLSFFRSCARLIRSARAGVGKSLTKFNLCNQVRSEKKLKGKDITIPVYKTIDTDSIIAKLNAELGNGYSDPPHHTIHIDIAHEVESGVDEMLFNLVVLRSLVNSEGVVWQSQQSQYYIIECMPYTKVVFDLMGI